MIYAADILMREFEKETKYQHPTQIHRRDEKTNSISMGPSGTFLRRLNRIKSYQILVTALLALAIYNEYLSCLLYRLCWPTLTNVGPAEDNVRVLLVADPQLIGLQNEDHTFGPITRWDCDRYLSRSFSHAYSFMKPDVVIFLGDLLDEGSESNDAEYQGYVDRFNAIFNSTGNTKHIYLPGDNDVGGEGFDRLESWKVRKFEQKFNRESGKNSVKFVDFIHLNYQFGVETDSRLLSLAELLRAQSKGDFRILLNHFGILERSFQQYNMVLKAVAPSIVFTAHHHKSYGIKCDNCDRQPLPVNRRDRFDDITSWAVLNIPLTLKNANSFQEIAVPTCSYRMGVKSMGYGAAVISSDGMMQYSVLWIPSRYDQLFSYIVVPLLLLGFMALRFVVQVVIMYRREFCGLR